MQALPFDRAPNLQKFGQRLFAQPVAASACERNWSLLSWIIGQRRHRLNPETLKRLVVIQTESLTRRAVSDDDESTLPWITDTIEVVQKDDPEAEYLLPEGDTLLFSSEDKEDDE